LFGRSGDVTVLVEESPVGQIKSWISSPIPQHEEKGLGYIVVLEEDEDGGYVATVPALVGCVTEGDTPEEVLGYLRDALEAWIEVAQNRGLNIPHPDDVHFL